MGLGRQPLEAKAFYATVAAATLIGVAVNFTELDPIRALYWSAVLNGVIGVPILGMMVRVAADPRIMGKFAIGEGLRLGGWLATAVMAASVLATAAIGGLALLG